MSSLPIPRLLLQKYFGDDLRMLNAMDDISRAAADATNPLGSAALINGMAAENVVVLNPGSAFTNESALTNGFGILFDINPGSVSVRVDPTAYVTTASPVLNLKTLGNFTTDANAAAGGVPIGGIYRNASQLCVRVT